MLSCIGWGCAALAALSLLVGQTLASYSIEVPQPAAGQAAPDHGPGTISYETVDGQQVACLHEDGHVTCVNLVDHSGHDN